MTGKRKPSAAKARQRTGETAVEEHSIPLPPLSKEQLAALAGAVRAGEEAVTQALEGVVQADEAVAQTDRTVAATSRKTAGEGLAEE